jgi:hypothetical protein
MTPLEIFEYKQRWKSRGYSVRLHSDLEHQGKEYCKVQMHKQQWDMIKWTDVYEHTFIFEFRQDAEAFKKHFGRFADQEPIISESFQKLNLRTFEPYEPEA